MTGAAFRKAERTRQLRRPASAPQRRELDRLARMAGIETPRVYWACDASDAISRLEAFVRQPTLGAMG